MRGWGQGFRKLLRPGRRAGRVGGRLEYMVYIALTQLKTRGLLEYRRSVASLVTVGPGGLQDDWIGRRKNGSFGIGPGGILMVQQFYQVHPRSLVLGRSDSGTGTTEPKKYTENTFVAVRRSMDKRPPAFVV